MFKIVFPMFLLFNSFFLAACSDQHKEAKEEKSLTQKEETTQKNDTQASQLTKNRMPFAYAGDDQEVYIYDEVLLEGRGSKDPDRDELTYHWFFKRKPPESNSRLEAPHDANSKFIPDRAGLYIVGLIVNDGVQNSKSSYIKIKVKSNLVQIPVEEDVKQDEVSGNIIDNTGVNENIIASNTSSNISSHTSSSTSFSKKYYQYVATDSNSSVTIFLSGYASLESELLSYELYQSPKYGTINGTFPNLTYMSNTNDLQEDCFIVEVFKGSESINKATVFIENISGALSSQVADIDIEELGVYFHVNEQNYYEKLTLLKSNGRIEQSGISYEFVPAINQDNIGSMYITLTNTDESDLRYAKVFFFLDTSIEQSKNSFFNEYGQYIAVRGIGSGDLEADFWQIDEPDYLDGHIVANLQKGILDQTNHIEVGSSEDVSMALGFEIENFKAGSSLSFRLDLGVENTGSGLSQIDTTSKSEIFYNVTLQDPSLFLCE